MRSRVLGPGRISEVIILVLLLAATVSLTACGSSTRDNVLTDNISQPLDDATTAIIDIDAGTGNLIIDRLADGDEPVLASGTLQYIEGQDRPTQAVSLSNGQATLTLKGGDSESPRFRLPWAACNGATEWQIHLNPAVSSNIAAHSNGGNVKLDLAGMAVTRVSADTEGGNVDVVLPENAAGLNVLAKSGAGNVTVKVGNDTTGSNTVNANSGTGDVVVHIPSGMAARIHATTRLGKVIIDPRFGKISDDTYQSSDFDSAANKIDITLDSNAGNVSVNIKE